MKLVKSLAANSLIWVVVSLGLMLTLAGCVSTSPTVEAPSLTPVNVQLAWIYTIEYSGFYMAQDKGYYADENLAVELTELGSVPPVDQVVAGKAQFGLTSADTLLLARAKGAPVVAIATIYQRSPIAFISLAEKNIVRPQDLVGKTVIVDFDGTTGIAYQAMLTSQGLDPSQVNGVMRADFSNDPLIKGQADVIDAFINNQPVQLEEQGYKINAILPGDYGIEMYANVIFTTEDTIANRPELVERFLRATVRGMQDAIDDPDKATALAVARNDKLNPASEGESMRRSLPLVNPAGSKPGMMQAKAWETAYQILRDQGILDKPLDVKAAYTLSFLEKIYSN